MSITIDLSEEQVDTILTGLICGEFEGQLTKKEVSDLYWALGKGDKDPYADQSDMLT